MSQKRKALIDRPALDIIEEATRVLRTLPASAFVVYYTGTLPFIGGFLYFWTDMSTSAFAHSHAASAAFSLSVLFVWMKYWHTAFARRLTGYLSNEPVQSRTLPQALWAFCHQSAIQSTGFILLPISLLITIPFGWMFAFYQNVSVFGDGTDHGLRMVVSKSWEQARLSTGQNHKILAALLLFGLFVFLNIATVVFLAPHLLETFFGIETAFSRAGINLMNTTYFAVVLGLSYLVMDPLVKSIYILRCFYGESLSTGKDLLTELKGLSARKAIAGLLVILCFMMFPLGAYQAYGENGAPQAGNSISAEAIDEAIGRVIEERQYSWRMPREAVTKESKPGLIPEFFAGAMEVLSDWLSPVWDGIKSMAKWLAEKLEDLFSNTGERQSMSTGPSKSLEVLAYILIGAVACILLFFIVRALGKRQIIREASPADAGPEVTDLSREEVSADALPTNSWLELAHDLIRKGDLRLALRALYLASLSHLAQQEFITIALFKSNREYERELERKAHTMPELITAFSRNVGIFEYVWYGMHDVTEEIMSRFQENQKQVITGAEH